MYNLLMVYREGTWGEDEFVVEHARFLQHTVGALAAKFKALDDKVIEELKRLPTLFAYEDRSEAEDSDLLSARVGRITSIRQLSDGLRITWKFDDSIQPIHPSSLRSMFERLDISKKSWAHRRSHWAVKDVDLLGVLRDAGLTVTIAAPRPPLVFISYSWDSPEHIAWALKLSEDLRARGVDATLDQTHLRLGQDTVRFMEEIERSDRVVVVCTTNYMSRASTRVGGAGYEHRITANELIADEASNKYIPVLRDTSDRDSMPAALKGRLFLDLGDRVYRENLEVLVRELHGAYIKPKPLGPPPIF